MKVAIVLGTRPQIIKSAPMVSAFERVGIDCSIVNTGQHYDYEMNRAFFSELKLPEPAADLSVGAGTPNEQISRIIAGLELTLPRLKPNLVLVPGDTNSALAAGIACSKRGLATAHLESGCRSNDLGMSEEVNRRLLDHMSNVLLCPTSACVRNVRSERVLAEVVSNVGDTMYDSVIQCMGAVRRSGATGRYGVKKEGFAFMTLHRAENVDSREKLSSILSAVSALDLTVLFSAHPRTRSRLSEFAIETPSNVKMLDPLPYFDSLRLVKDSRFVITDSGGLQKEAFWFRRPCLITRETTEWLEIVRAGVAFLVGTDARRIMRGYHRLQGLERDAFEVTPIFGNGDAAGKAASVVKRYLDGVA